jgi:hypothetical protein
MLATKVFGRDEDGDGGMELRQPDVDAAVDLVLMLLDLRFVGGTWPLSEVTSEVVLELR